MSTQAIQASQQATEYRNAFRSAQVFGKGRYFEPGRYLLEVDKLFYKRTLIDGAAKESIICEFKILESSNPAFEVGSTVSSVFSFANKGWLSRFKMMVLALVGADPDRAPAAAQEAAGDIYAALRDDSERERIGLPENFMRGRKVRTEAMAGKTSNGQDITNMKWEPVAQ